MSMGPFSPQWSIRGKLQCLMTSGLTCLDLKESSSTAMTLKAILEDVASTSHRTLEFVTVDLDQLSLRDISSPPSLSDSNTIKPYSPATPTSPEVKFTELLAKMTNLRLKWTTFS